MFLEKLMESYKQGEAHGSIVVKAIGYKPEGRGFETQGGE
jgi:hypothetical protein